VSDLVEDLIRQFCPPDKSWVPSVQADKILAELRTTPRGRKELAAWLDEHAHELLTIVIQKRRPRINSRSQRTDAMMRAWTEQLSCDGNIMKPASEMTRDDHMFVASRYRMSEISARHRADFHSAVAEKLADGQRTSDVFSAETYNELFAASALEPLPDADPS
jgi:hypothetical protein